MEESGRCQHRKSLTKKDKEIFEVSRKLLLYDVNDRLAVPLLKDIPDSQIVRMRRVAENVGEIDLRRGLVQLTFQNIRR